MSTVMMSADLPHDANHAPHHRRSREEVEALAKNFVATPIEEAAPPKSRSNLALAAAAGAVVLASVVAYVAWPSSQQAARPVATNDRVAAEVEELRLRLEAERERQRQELQAGADYMAKTAAADAALVKDMSSQAEMLAKRAEAAPARPAPSTSAAPATVAPEREPTPRDAPPPSAPAAAVASAPQKSTTTPAQTSSAPAAAQPAAKPAAAVPAPVQAAPATQVAQASPDECTIHVSELSKSGKLTYADVAKMKGARLNEKTGSVFTPPVQAGGRSLVFEVMPNGCVEVARTLNR